MTAFEEIREIVDWFRDLPSDYLGINDLIYQRQRLVGFYFEFSSQLGFARQVWAESQADYEKKKLQLRVAHQAKGVTKANSISRANSAKEYEEQQKAEGTYYKMFYTYKSIEHVINAMNQQIAHLREELKKSNFSR